MRSHAQIMLSTMGRNKKAQFCSQDCQPRNFLSAAGSSIPEAQVLHPLSEDLALSMYTSMVKLQTMDVIFYEAQRQV